MTATTYKGAVAQVLVGNSKQWIDSDVFAQVGGRDGTRRVRELRSDGWQIKSRRNPDAPTTFQYMLSRVPAKRVIAQYV